MVDGGASTSVLLFLARYSSPRQPIGVLSIATTRSDSSQSTAGRSVANRVDLKQNVKGDKLMRVDQVKIVSGKISGIWQTSTELLFSLSKP